MDARPRLAASDLCTALGLARPQAVFPGPCSENSVTFDVTSSQMTFVKTYPSKQRVPQARTVFVMPCELK